MAKEYQPTVVRLADGRVVTGILKEETGATPSACKRRTSWSSIAKADIDELKLSDKSMMPDDQLKPLTPHEVRSLVAYLGCRGQTPHAGHRPTTSARFFNGKDLTGWVGDDKLW